MSRSDAMSNARVRKLATVLAVIVALTADTLAHEYWIEPAKFSIAKGEKTQVKLLLGDGLIKDVEERPFQADKTALFSVFSRRQTVDLRSGLTDGATPLYEFTGAEVGNYLFAMERNWSYITLEPDQFDAYLREDGMEYIIAEREKLGESKRPGRERYARFLKSLLQVGGRSDDTYKKRTGLKLELIPQANPYSKKVGDLISFQVVLDNAPLAGYTVFADNRQTGKKKLLTDKNGKFTFKLDAPGLWLTRLVFMRRCKVDCGDADWESFWASFSFGVE